MNGGIAGMSRAEGVDDGDAPVASPCTRVCRIDEPSGLCIGCLRTLDEIVRWGSMEEGERRRVCSALPLRRLGHAGGVGPPAGGG